VAQGAALTPIGVTHRAGRSAGVATSLTARVGLIGLIGLIGLVAASGCRSVAELDGRAPATAPAATTNVTGPAHDDATRTTGAPPPRSAPSTLAGPSSVPVTTAPAAAPDPPPPATTSPSPSTSAVPATRPPGPRTNVVVPSGARPRLDGRHIGLVSDSMLAGGAGDIVARQLSAAGAVVTLRDARGGFALFQHPGLVEALGNGEPEVIVGVFGYNDIADLWVSPGARPTVYAAFDRAVATAAASDTCWVWPTIGTDFTTYTTLGTTQGHDLADARRLALELDDRMIATAGRSPNIRVLDWQPLIDAHRLAWTGDGLHFNGAGAASFAQAAVEAVATCPPLTPDLALRRAAEVGGTP
jgi:hypothetical protein